MVNWFFIKKSLMRLLIATISEQPLLDELQAIAWPDSIVERENLRGKRTGMPHCQRLAARILLRASEFLITACDTRTSCNLPVASHTYHRMGPVLRNITERPYRIPTKRAPIQKKPSAALSDDIQGISRCIRSPHC